VKPDRSSLTAMMAAAMRAIESEKPEAERVCYDPLARRLIGNIPFWFLKALYLKDHRSGVDILLPCALRCRVFDEYLQYGLDSGITQVVILGAGWDSRAYRGKLSERRIKTFEIDHPATQAAKIRAVQRVFHAIPPHVVFIPIDFTSGTLNALPSHGWDDTQKTLFLWEGVTYYLNAEAVDTVLAWIGSRSAPGSLLAFDYKRAGRRNHRPIRRRRLLPFLARRNKELRTYCMERDQVEDLLTRRGFTNITEINLNPVLAMNRKPAASFRRNWKKNSIVCAETGKPADGRGG
jgi:methyltransferase (TIGR00027 family)